MLDYGLKSPCLALQNDTKNGAVFSSDRSVLRSVLRETEDGPVLTLCRAVKNGERKGARHGPPSLGEDVPLFLGEVR